MNAWPAALVAALCLWFSVSVFRQWFSRKRMSLGYWGASLVLSTLGSLAYCLTLWTQPHATWAFYGYYLCGAMWMPCIMGLGSLALMLPKWFVWTITAIIFVVGLFGSVFLWQAPVSASLLQSLNGGAGTGILGQNPRWLIPLICLNSVGAAAVLVVALASVWKRIRQKVQGRFLFGNLSLAVGILIISGAGSAARLGWPGLFWITMLIGWVVTFVGYRWLTPLA